MSVRFLKRTNTQFPFLLFCFDNKQRNKDTPLLEFNLVDSIRKRQLIPTCCQSPSVRNNAFDLFDCIKRSGPAYTLSIAEGRAVFFFSVMYLRCLTNTKRTMKHKQES